MVVARAKVGIALERVALAAHEKQHFCVGLVAHHAVNNDCAGFLQNAGEANVFLFVEAGAQLDNYGDFGAKARRLCQRLN